MNLATAKQTALSAWFAPGIADEMAYNGHSVLGHLDIGAAGSNDPWLSDPDARRDRAYAMFPEAVIDGIADAAGYMDEVEDAHGRTWIVRKETERSGGVIRLAVERDVRPVF